MPAIRIDKAAFSYNPVTAKTVKKSLEQYVAVETIKAAAADAAELSFEEDDVPKDIYFPVSPPERKAFRTKEGKSVTSHHWDVYDFTLTIPSGKVTTYKDVSLAVGGSPRSVGTALRNNPFAPYVPCHRVIASNFFIGGFFGEWGANHKTGTRCGQKTGILMGEGVTFDGKGHLLDAEHCVWRG